MHNIVSLQQILAKKNQIGRAGCEERDFISGHFLAFGTQIISTTLK